jgi:hypothetical protein
LKQLSHLRIEGTRRRKPEQGEPLKIKRNRGECLANK